MSPVSGVLAPDYADALEHESAAGDGTVTVSPLGEGRFLVRADRHGPLCDLLARVPRPSGRGLRVEVDPSSI